MNTLRYKGYVGSVAYSEQDKVFFGKIEGIEGLVNYEGESVKELTDAFKEAVDDYLVFCQEKGIVPQKSYTGTFNVRISPETHREIANLAAQAGISINAFVKNALDDAVKQPRASFSSMFQGYGTNVVESAVLMEPEAEFGVDSELKFIVPDADVSLARDLARRLGWNMVSE